MKANLILSVALVLTSMSSFAASGVGGGTIGSSQKTKDLRTLNTLLQVGVASEQFMSQVHVGLDQIECAYSMVSKVYDCNMTDISANEAAGATLNLTGNKAKAVYAILVKAGAPSDNGMGKIFLSAKSIRCSQAVAGVMDGSAAERTHCSFDVSAD